MFEVRIKSGDSGHFNYDGCDMYVATIPSNNIPSVGDRLEFDNDKCYLVKEIQRYYWDIEGCITENIVVYVLKI